MSKKRPVTKFLLELLLWLPVYLGVLFLVTLCWVGAECIFESCVHSSDVDGAVAGILSYYITLRLRQLDKEVVKRHG